MSRVILQGDPKGEHVYLERIEDSINLVSVERASSKMGLTQFRYRYMLTDEWARFYEAVMLLEGEKDNAV